MTNGPLSTAEPVRCKWAASGNASYLAYHDCEWGVAIHDDRELFEFLLLEGAQAGLSWSTILNKRAGYRNAFANFDPVKISAFGQREIDDLVKDSSIVRHRGKIESAISNARCFLETQQSFGSFDQYLWRFVDGSPRQNAWKSGEDVPTRSPESDALSRDLKQRGFKFAGTTIMYAFMQATGMVNDHTIDCFRWAQLNMA
ncbi:MAG TPA: DNA-3-methyladenine glycosylase I [Burkholderiales bacterium]|nr:DNA-3-methyladenine glycosylase I [Burkholderiales bacterium]